MLLLRISEFHTSFVFVMQTVLSMFSSIKVTSFSSQKRAQLLHQINLSKDLFGHSCYLFLELELQVDEEDP